MQSFVQAPKGGALYSDQHFKTVLQQSAVGKNSEPFINIERQQATIEQTVQSSKGGSTTIASVLIVDKSLISADHAALQAVSACRGLSIVASDAGAVMPLGLVLTGTQALIYNSTLQAKIKFFSDSYLVHTFTASLKGANHQAQIISEAQLYLPPNPGPLFGAAAF